MSKVLIIEDQEEIRENLSELLEISDFDVITAVNGQNGLQQIQSELPDIILCDISMPVMDGYEVLKQVRNNVQTKKTPFVFISASAQDADIMAGKIAGADAYLTKPFSLQKLINTIELLVVKQPH
ncbi:MAG: response regulator [Bacteroidota bacterium]